MSSKVIVNVARVRRRGENQVSILKTKNANLFLCGGYWGDKKLLSFIGRKWNGSRHLVF